MQFTDIRTIIYYSYSNIQYINTQNEYTAGGRKFSVTVSCIEDRLAKMNS